MSDGAFKPLTWLRAVLDESCTLDPYEAVVMLALVRYADDQGQAWPGFGALGRVTRVSRTRLIKALDALERRGCFYRVVQKRGQGFGTNVYELVFPPPASALGAPPEAPTGARGSAPHAPGSAQQTLPVVRGAYSGSAPGAPYLPIDLSNRTDQGTAGARGSAPQTPPEKPAKATRKPRAKAAEVALPADWKPTEAHRDFAAKNGLDVELEARGFRGHAESKARTAVSWNGAFTTWLTNQVRWNRGRRGTKPVQQGGTIQEGDSSWLDAGGAE